MKNQTVSLSSLLRKHQREFSAVLDWPEKREQVIHLDLSSSNQELQEVNLKDTQAFQNFINRSIEAEGGKMGIGGYLENRAIYRRSDVFGGSEDRSIHLGIDIWAPAFSTVYAPLEARVHSLQDNDAFGDYGPTIILLHELEGMRFFTLYGHLSRASIKSLSAGQKVEKGSAFTELGPFPENGDWPSHLHFQLILDLGGNSGDFPGVAAPSELEKYKRLCPDPQLLLKLPD
ncbi:peptidoglycan DD-metalloendopeptidase family protein [Nafulsella turpanensis]|uniref:peptidoglycan DD-metalloendopeptidase family protein n=1 Tax=Nafulsella turpanensis TaxID=1265690 RepID=UPI00034BD454|nr:peptidoglycan DD-metalloendopeptidase family protein [Nafulsella turpanensis]